MSCFEALQGPRAAEQEFNLCLDHDDDSEQSN